MPPSTPCRVTQRPSRSHLRHVSSGSPETMFNNRPVSVTSDTGTVQHEPTSLKVSVQKNCVLWVHDEGFAKEEVVLNLDLFPNVRPGDLVAIMPLKVESVIRDFQDKPAATRRDGDALGAPMRRQRSSSNPQSLGGSANGLDAKYDEDLGSRYLFLARDMSKEMKAKHPNLEVSIAKSIADIFCLKHRSNIILTTTDASVSTASHVELSFKDEYLARSDMWRLAVSELSNKTVFKGQKVLFMGTIKAQVASIYVDGRKVRSALYCTNTKPIFRSESARYVLFIQMSREMWDFDSEGSGEIMFNKVVNGFLPALFKKWASIKAKHLVTIVLFTRVEYDTGIASHLATSGHDTSYHTGMQTDGNKRPYKDFYKVVVSEMGSGSWTTILYQLKREFKFFRRDISMHRVNTTGPEASTNAIGDGAIGTRIEAQPSLAMHGNVLEAINLASSQFSHDYIDRDLMRTGISVVVVTPCAGLFEVDYETLRMTTEALIGNGIGIDLVCLPKMPLHSVPLFRYRNPQYAIFQEAMHMKALRSEDSTPRQTPGTGYGSFSSLNESLPLPSSKASQPGRSLRAGSTVAVSPPSEWSYAIPHWADVSFWTGATQEISLANASTKVGHKFLKSAAAKRRSEFEVRCKMYELEMASVMENIMSEIVVAPLKRDMPLLQVAKASAGATSSPGEYYDTFKQSKVYTSLLEFVNGPLQPVSNKKAFTEGMNVYTALDEFDAKASELRDGPSLSRHYKEEKKSFKVVSEETTMKLLVGDPKVLGTSPGDATGSVKGAGLASGRAASARTKQERKSLDESPSARRNTGAASSLITNSRPPPTRPTKFGRQISLGKFGFGIAAPKAATAEIHAEHASAAKPTAATAMTTARKAGADMKDHLITATASQTQDRPSSSQSEGLSVNSKSSSETPRAYHLAAKAEKTASTAPMTMKSVVHNLDSTNQFKSRSVLGSVYEVTDRQQDGDSSHYLPSTRLDDTQKLYNSKLLAGSVPELPATLSPTTALSPWLSILNPSNPSVNDELGPSQYRRWQHVFPRPVSTKTMKWKSLCSPASVPLTTEYFPTKHQLDTEYQRKPYNISQNAEDDLNEISKTRAAFMRELIGLRLSQGFQIVVGPAISQAFGQRSMRIADVFEPDCVAEDGVSVFMSMGNIIHQLSSVNETEIEVNQFVRKPMSSTLSSSGNVMPSVYNPAIRTTLSTGYCSRQIILGKSRDEYNWNYVDNFIAGFDEDMSESLRFWRARFVLIPVERPTQSQRQHMGEDNEEEIRLEGIKKLTHMWQRHRVLTPSERRFQSLAAHKTKDPNPLDIVYKTEDPSVVVTAELETLPLVDVGDTAARRTQLLETERFRRSKVDIEGLAEAIQSPVEKGGVRMQNRRWHFRLHYNCFIGSDMTTWLIENFEDIETREEAVDFGNLLMAKDELHRFREKEVGKDNGKDKDMGLFVHVEKRHPFRDGQYFYQVTGQFAKQRPESRSGWFASKRRDGPSVPSTPMSENMCRDSPRPERSVSSANYEEKSSDSGTTTPTTGSGKRPKVALSKVMKYDVDPRKRSYRPERINLHYDRLHNPDNCYHLRIDWMGATAKLIEDAIESWAVTAERYGLRLVEAPVGEVCSITTSHPFRSPYQIKIAAQPPAQQPRTYFDASSFAPQVQTSPASRHYYQKAIMKKFNFVLDIEAARNFPSNVDVTYSWGRPDFKYTQYIHRSGVLLAQITDEGNFLLLANRLYNNRTTAAREESLVGSKLASFTTPDTIKNDLESFCNNASLLELFYKEVFEKAMPPQAPTPPTLRSPYVGTLLDSHIPTLGLPPNLLAREGRDPSPSPMRLSSLQQLRDAMPSLGRKQSVQYGGSSSVANSAVSSAVSGGDIPRQESPRGSIAGEDKTL